MSKKASKKLRQFTRGMIIAYIGNGKGKTTASVGAAVRARGYGWTVLFFQFFKSPEWPSGERTALHTLGIDVEVHGKGFVGICGDEKPRRIHSEAAKKALRLAEKAIVSGKWKLIVLDEIISCVEEKLFPADAVVSMLKRVRVHARGKQIHIILTGHRKYSKILKQCDIVTEMKMLKHLYYKGYIAHKGIDF
ncbi:MAG: cob(I)yrinic acid a,c-diamide adenosyltransferase [Patescibacteria group bacterium]|jgi:cob(I)alamin adenosyltransferase